MAEPHDLLKARRESAALLGLGDVERLSPADTLRCDLISTLRLAIDGEQATVLDGGAADLAKLITATENLIRLLPGHELPEPAAVEGGPSDPRRIMWENYKRMRDRGAAFGEGYDGKVRRIAELEAEIAELRGNGSVTTISEGPAEPAPDNVVPLSRPTGTNGPVAAPPRPAPPAPPRGLLTDSSEPEPWRPFVGGGSRRDPWADNRN